MTPSNTRQSWPMWLLLGLLIFTPRLLRLDQFLTADEPLFLEHARAFAAAMTGGDLAQTAGIGYPGATVAAWAAPAVTWPQTDMAAYAAGRAAVGLLNGLLLLALFALARRLLGQWPAFIGVALLALDPYALSYHRLLHIAGPLATLMTLAGLALLLRLRDGRRRWLLLVGCFSGLALLTKSTALLLGPMLIGLTLAWGVAAGVWQQPAWQRRQLLDGLAVLGVVAVVFIVLWPAMWVDPAGTLSLTFGKLFTDQEAGAGNLGLFWLGEFVQNPGPAFYLVAFLLKGTPWLLLGLPLSLYVLRRPTTPHRPETLALWLFALIYLLLMTIASKKSIRYMLPAFPSFCLLAGAAFHQFGVWLQNIPQIARSLPPFAIRHSQFAIPLLLLILLPIFYHPYYLSYYNPMLMGWRWAPHTLLVGWGEGLDQAAHYLNDQPPATVAAWYEWLFPVMYHNGETQPVVPQENLLTAGYAVLYINQVQRDIPGPNIIHYFRTRRRPEHTIRLNGINYAWIYPGPVAGLGREPTPQFPLTGSFGSELSLLGYDLRPQPVSGSRPLIVTLHWRVLTPPTGDRFVFVRLVDAAGHIWAQNDSPPVMGLWPEARWQPDMIIEDAHELLIPAGTPPGQYRLEVGLYEPESGRPLAASGQPLGRGGGLRLGEVAVDWLPVPAAAVDLDRELSHVVDMPLSPNADLIGYSSLPPSAATGDSLPLSLAWRESRSLLQFGAIYENYVMFGWFKAEGDQLQLEAEQLDPLPLPIEQWGRGAILRSQHGVLVPATLTSGQYRLQAALHTGSDPAGDWIELARLDASAPPHQFELPAGAIIPAGPARLQAPPARAATAPPSVMLAGYSLSQGADALETGLFWQTDGQLLTGYTVFVQLLSAETGVVAQSDAAPAAGQRPTPGWLPGEIIIDGHTLSLPPDLPPGRYRLIAGLYNPLDGQRLPLIDGGGDAITVANVTLE